MVVPIVVADKGEPSMDLLAGLAQGLGVQGHWQVQYGGAGRQLAPPPATSVADDRAQALTAELEAAARASAEGRKADAVTNLTGILSALRELANQGPLGAAGDDLLIKAGVALIGVLVSQGQDVEAQKVANEIASGLPGRSFDDVPGAGPVVTALLKAATLEDAVNLELISRPVGCAMWINGRTVGVAPVTVKAREGIRLSVHAVCPPEAPGGGERPSRTRVVKVKPTDANRQQEVVDLAFERAFENGAEGGRLRFSSSAVRRQNEPAYAARVASMLDADLVVFAGVGELGGTEWLNARLYLRSGFKNRQGLARLETERAVALGRYLATGKDSPGVLRSDEAGALVAATRPSPRLIRSTPERVPWYADPVGWSLVGAGAVAFGFGLWATDKADDKFAEANRARNEPFRKQDLRSEATTLSFVGDIGTFGGGVLVVTGLLLLVTPEYTESRSELFVLRPLPGGAAAAWSGRF
jgi:hypothetical protein